MKFLVLLLKSSEVQIAIKVSFQKRNTFFLDVSSDLHRIVPSSEIFDFCDKPSLIDVPDHCKFEMADFDDNSIADGNSDLCTKMEIENYTDRSVSLSESSYSSFMSMTNHDYISHTYRIPAKSQSGSVEERSNCLANVYSVQMFQSSDLNEDVSDLCTAAISDSDDKPVTNNESRKHRTVSSFEISQMCNGKGEKFYTDLKVTALESYESLKQKCNKLGLKLNDYILYEDLDSESNSNTLDNKTYEVDLIFSHMIMDDETYFFVKWKNFTTVNSTWEPECNLTGCKQVIEYYHAMENVESKMNKRLLQYFLQDLITRKPYDILTLTKVCALCLDCSEKDVSLLQLTKSQMKQKVKEILTYSSSKISKISDQLFKIMKFGEVRKRVLIHLKEWESEINLKNELTHIKVENDIDLEIAPTAFQFIHDYINTMVYSSEEPVAFCHCQNCYVNKKSCCPKDSDGRFAYNKHRKLILKPGFPIYECNKRCACGSNCANRVVQHGQKLKVSIFRTPTGCGWGLKTLEPIDEGEFVCEYLGEIITFEAAEERGKIYDYTERSYLFDLDYGVDSCSYTVDAGHFGNVSHFINHSCDPNLHVFAVWINQPDPNLPRLALFAKRRIEAGDELTFDYKMVQRDRYGPQSPLDEDERTLCLCKSQNCKKFLF